MYACKQKVNSSKVFVYPHVKREYLNVSGDFDVHVKFRISKCSKYINFIKAMDVVYWLYVLLFFRLGVRSCRVVWSNKSFTWKNWEWERKLSRCQREREREREKESFRRQRICTGNYVTWQAPNARFIFAWNQFKMRGRSWKNRQLTFLSNQVLEFIPAPDNFYFEDKWTLDPIFPEFFCSTCSSPAI